MKTCTNCGVELEENMNFCPLCGEPVTDENRTDVEYIEVRKRKQEDKLLRDYQKLSDPEKLKLFWEISGIILISGIIVTLVVDLIGDNNISWSRYTISVCAILFVCTTLICFWSKRIILLLLGSFVSTALFLILLDMFTGSIDWGVTLGIPLLFATYIIISGLIWMIRNAKEKALNLIAYSFVAAGLLCICIEGIISLYIDEIFRLHWSLVVVASILPVAALLFFIHFRLKKGTDLKRFFHI